MISVENKPDFHAVSEVTKGSATSILGSTQSGVPLITQRVSLDFTPQNDDIDNGFVEKKVCSFWDFIRNSPEIHNLKARPKKKTFPKSSGSDVIETTKPEAECSNVVDVERTAVDMLDIAEQKGLIDRIFEAKMPQSHCSLGSLDYKECEPNKQHNREKKKRVCACTIVCAKPCPGGSKLVKPPAEYLSTTRILSRKMKQWDTEHPKSMEPPGHPPSLQHAIMQRQLYH